MKWDWSMRRIAWIDVETDGLVRAGKPFPLMLEVALIVTDEDLRELARYEAVIRHTARVLDALDPHPAVLDMHEKNGLWADLRRPGVVPVGVAESRMVRLLDSCQREGPVIWGGFSPGQVDRPMIGHCMPGLFDLIHHRTLDASALKLAMLNWGGVEIPKSEALHRAMPDTEASIEVTRTYRQCLLNLAADRKAGIAQTASSY